MFNLNGQEIAPGENTRVRLHIGQIPSGNEIDINAFVYRSLEEGPILLVLGGVHGDEINGVEIVRRAIARGLFTNLKKGSVIAIPLLNVYGFINFSREVPDGKDVNRSFPGSIRGSLASRVARVLTKNVLPLVTHAVDFHTGGASRYNYPQIRYASRDEGSRLLAEQFGAPFSIKSPPIPKSLRRAALDMNIPIIIYEGGEATRFDGFSLEKGKTGLLRLMHANGMIETAPAAERSIAISKSSWLRAPVSGIFRWTQSSGQKVRAGEPLGVICDPYGQNEVSVKASKSGYIIGHNNAPVVSMGDALFHIGFP